MDDILSIQLYSVRDALSSDFEGTLKRLKDMGYSGVEFAGIYGDMSDSELAGLMARLGLVTVGAHMGLDELENNFDWNADRLRALGCDHMICPWAKVDTAAEAEELGARLCAISEKCAMAGFRFSYHNHGHEFAQTEDGRYLFDILMESGGDLLMAELDIYWIAFAGADVEETIRKYAGRMALLHLKQMAETDGVRHDVLFDKGVLDMKKLMAVAKLMGVESFIVEEETPCEDMLDAVQVDIRYLKSL